jgi:hypothetical protein
VSRVECALFTSLTAPRSADILRGLGANFLPLADGQGDVHISCLHLESKSCVAAPSITHAAAVLIFHGKVIIESDGIRSDFSAGIGAIFDTNEPYTLESEPGAILLIVETQELIAHARGISTPQRIAGQSWPGKRLSSPLVPRGAASEVPTRLGRLDCRNRERTKKNGSLGS